jgi:predicted ArsR family transcriptional regulator
VLHRCGPSYREQIAKKFGYTATAIGLAAKKLEEVGLVEREVKHLALRRRAGRGRTEICARDHDRGSVVAAAASGRFAKGDGAKNQKTRPAKIG